MMATGSETLQSYIMNSDSSLNAKGVFAQGGDILTPLNFYLSVLDNVDPILLPYMDEARIAQLRYDLRIAYVLLLAQLQYELTQQKTENKLSYVKKIKQVRALIEQCCISLDNFDPQYRNIITKAPEQAYFSDAKPVKYCGITLAKELATKIHSFVETGKTKPFKEMMGSFNEKRLYWVWGSAFLKTVLSMVSEDFFNVVEAKDVICAPDRYTGCLSWSLYYFRFSLNLFLLLKHTIKHPWMSEEEASVGWVARFQTQWAQRKFELLNDSIWATANLVCFFWLNGNGALGAGGDLLTICLLVFDVVLTLWDFEEQQANHRAQMMEFEKDITSIAATLAELLMKVTKDKEDELKIVQMQMQLNALERARKQCVKDWQMKQVNLFHNIAYAVSLTIAFVILTTPFMPVTASVGAVLGIVGAVLCFTLTIISNAIKSGREIHQSRQSIKDKRADRQQHFAELKKLLDEDVGLDDNRIKLYYLEIMKCEAETEYQRNVMAFQTAQLVRNIIIDTLIPAVIFVSLVLLPLGVGLGAMGGALGLAVASKTLINALFKTDEKMKQLPDFDTQRYETICRSVKQGQSGVQFFDLPAQKKLLSLEGASCKKAP